MGNPVGMFKKDPQDLPGQGLARADNYNAGSAGAEYRHLLEQYGGGLSTGVGLEETYGPQFAAARLKNLDTTLTGNSDQPGVVQLYLDALRLVDPESFALLDSLTRSASGELELDNQLDPGQTRLVEQSGRASAAARGMGFGPSDAFAESFAKLGYGDALRDKRRGNALNLSTLRRNIAARPADMATDTAMKTNPNMLSSESLMAMLNNVYGQNQENNRHTSTNETQLAGKFVDMMGSLI